ncbi:MAG: F-type H+-transporting ATPase subunit gamma [Fusobacteria bacterium]|nr:MAG: F-type H+-transporting ATPase subunit gamma [Fusobacteriota bacterium]KAF0229801.1 MAG: F-type H+-transporting ATPase subunit [Fusobacteriota bacterium]
MAQLLEIKSRIRSVDSTLKITKAMKMIATARLARARDRFNKVKPVYERIETITNRMSNIENINEHELFKKRDVNKILFVVFSTNRGFCGGYNIRLFNYLEEQKHNYFSSDVFILPIGEKAVEYYDKYDNRINLSIVDEISWEKDMFNQSRLLMYDLKKMYFNADFDEIYIVYNSFKSILFQKPKIKKILPMEHVKENEQEILDYIFEPKREIILDNLLDTYLILTINTALIELETGEYGARMSAMDGANRNGEKLTKKLKIQFQRARQEAITREITEIIGGAETLRREKDE